MPGAQGRLILDAGYPLIAKAGTDFPHQGLGRIRVRSPPFGAETISASRPQLGLAAHRLVVVFVEIERQRCLRPGSREAGLGHIGPLDMHQVVVPLPAQSLHVLQDLARDARRCAWPSVGAECSDAILGVRDQVYQRIARVIEVVRSERACHHAKRGRKAPGNVGIVKDDRHDKVDLGDASQGLEENSRTASRSRCRSSPASTARS